MTSTQTTPATSEPPEPGKPPEQAIRQCEVRRETAETRIEVRVRLDLDAKGAAKAQVDTGVPFLDHMLISFARHSRLDLDVKVVGDLDIDDHHTVEDTGIVLGQALNKALGDKRGIARFGYAYAPMDEALARAVVDISGRPYLSYNAALDPTLGGRRLFHTDLAEEFWRAFVTNAGVTLHLDLLRGTNAHHCIEAMFKSVALAWYNASRVSNIPGVVPSTKGAL